MDNNPIAQVEKRLKRDNFNLFDGAIASVVFILVQFLFLIVLTNLLKLTGVSAVILNIAQILIEGSFFLSAYLVAAFRNVEFVSASRMRKKVDTKTILLSIVLAIVIIFAYAKLAELFIYFIQSLGFKYNSSYIDVSNVFMYILALFIHCAVPAVTEEVLFRGVICSGLEKVNKHVAVFVSAFIFMLMHGTPLQTVHQFILGIILGYIFVYTHNIWLTIIIHFVNNAFSVTAMFIQTMLDPSLAVPETGVVGFTPVEGNVLIINIVYGIIAAAVGSVVVVFLIKAIKNRNDQINGDKKQENQESQDNISIEQKVENSEDVKKQDKKEKIISLVVFLLSIGYLVGEWVSALIKGFLL